MFSDIDLIVILPLLLQLVGLMIAVFYDAYIGKKHKRIMMIIVALLFSLIVQNTLENRLITGDPEPFKRTIVMIYRYAIAPVILVLFLYIVDSTRKYTSAWILILVNAAIYLSALFSPVVFSIDEENNLQYGILMYFCLFLFVDLIVHLILLTVRTFQTSGILGIILPSFVICVSIIAFVLDGSEQSRAQQVRYLTIVMVSCSVFFYIWLHLQFEREHDQELQAHQRIQIMFSQIKPHFLYNSLGAIEELCDSDPQAAKIATAKFSRYLRGNLASITEMDKIPFAQELSHTKLYLELEQMRFEDALQIVYDINCTDFTIPTLTLEPLVENAVRHGIRGKENGKGTVTISSREFPDHFEVSVTDDGPGFDVGTVPNDGKIHIGISNVRTRLKRVCDGELVIRSAPGQGTTAAIILKKQKEDGSC